MTALSSYLFPPHEFDRRALVKAITPLVGPLDEDSNAEDFAGEVADAIHREESAESIVTTIYKDIIAVARSSGRCVYSDDRFLRRMLAAEGIGTVGTATLLDTLVESGAIKAADRTRGLDALRERRAINLLPEE